MTRTLCGVVAIVIAVGIAWIAVNRWSAYEIAVERRALDARNSELVQRALVPGSPLACLDAVANTSVETACEKALFASPEVVAAAIAYIDAKLSLLLDGIAHSAHDPGYATSLDRLRRGLETDRFGVVAQALTSRGCTADACPAFALFRNPWRIVTNLKQRTFDANVVLYASSWRAGSEALAAVAAPATTSSLPAPAAHPARGVPVSGKFDFPSAASIPAVSIMDTERPLSKAEETAIAGPSPARAAAPAATANATPTAPPARRQPPSRNIPGQPANVPLPLPAPGVGQR